MVKASLAWKKKFGFNDFNKIHPIDLMSMSGPLSNLDGVVNLPIWHCPDGHCISRVNSQGHVNPPCLAGDFGWDEKSVRQARLEGKDETLQALKPLVFSHIHLGTSLLAIRMLNNC